MCIATTKSGLDLDLIRPEAEHIELEDIAHGLAQKCRFNGQTRVFYSVAEHSVRVAAFLLRRYNNPALAIDGLMHDAQEAYFPDVHTDLKQYMSGYKLLEERMLQAIFEKFSLPYPINKLYKEADRILLATEGRDLMGWDLAHPKHAHLAKPLENVIEPWTMQEAKAAFLDTYYQLQDMRLASGIIPSLILKNQLCLK